MSTEYILLVREPGEDPDTRVWREIKGTFRASSARRALVANDVAEGEWVGVPARSFVPLTVKREQTTKVTIG